MSEHLLKPSETVVPEVDRKQKASPAQLAYEGIKRLVDIGYLEQERFDEILGAIQPSQ